MTQIDNDAYLILVYKDFDTILVSDYKEAVKVDTANIVDVALKSSIDEAFKIGNSKTTLWTKVKNSVTGSSDRLISAGLSSSIAQSMVSKSGLSSALTGRIQSSIYDIVKDGKISNQEVADDFIGSCVNELDSVAIKMGLPTPESLYDALKPNGAGVSGEFLNKFETVAKQIEEDNNKKKNAIAQDLTVLKFKLVTDDSETWASELPSRKTQNGFDIIDAIENSNKTKDFTVSLMNNPAKGVDIYAIKKAMEEDIRDKKIPFDIYVNDPYQKKRLVWKHCFFTNIAWSPEGTNTLNCTMGITKIPEYEVQSVSVSSVGGVPTGKRTIATSSNQKANLTKKPVKNTKNNSQMSQDVKERVSQYKREGEAIKTLNGQKAYSSWRKIDLPKKLYVDHITKTPDELGFPK